MEGHVQSIRKWYEMIKCGKRWIHRISINRRLNQSKHRSIWKRLHQNLPALLLRKPQVPPRPAERQSPCSAFWDSHHCLLLVGHVLNTSSGRHPGETTERTSNPEEGTPFQSTSFPLGGDLKVMNTGEHSTDAPSCPPLGDELSTRSERTNRLLPVQNRGLRPSAANRPSDGSGSKSWGPHKPDPPPQVWFTPCKWSKLLLWF